VPPPVILIPVNRLDRAKGRLAAVLTQLQREELAIATLTTAWRAAIVASEKVVVLTADPRVAVILGPNAVVLGESPAAHGLNAQLSYGTEDLLRTSPGRSLLILHADLPLATAAAIRDLIAAAPPAPSVTVVRSADGGTNAMLQTNPGQIPLAYGPQSAAKHEAHARVAGFAFTTHHSAELELDLDNPADLTTLLATTVGRYTLAGKALAHMDVRTNLGAAP
jgi:2-phospho-L-lactate/phosphoenolpyruvate guanylyltransferase